MARVGAGQTGIHPGSSDGVVVSDAAGVDRVLLGRINDEGDYGIQVTSSDGATVIIDGTSNMFKIIASGTTTITAPGASSSAQTSVGNIATGLDYPPAFQAWIELSAAFFADTIPFNFITSGGVITDNILAFTFPEMDDQTTFQVEWRTGPAGPAFGAGTFTVRYYLMQETAL